MIVIKIIIIIISGDSITDFVFYKIVNRIEDFITVLYKRKPILIPREMNSFVYLILNG